MTSQAGSKTRIGSDPVSELLRQMRIPRTRENWIKMAHMGKPPEDWGVDHEMDLPADLRKPLHQL